jgi:hypothetical protein
MPIFDITFWMPLPNALTTLWMAFAGVMPASAPVMMRSSTLSKAR